MQPKINYQALVESIHRAQLALSLDDSTRAWGGETQPGVRLTVGRGWEDADWGLWWGHYGQLSAGKPPHGYSYPFWTVLGLYRGSQAPKLARDILHELDRQMKAARARPKQRRVT